MNKCGREDLIMQIFGVFITLVLFSITIAFITSNNCPKSQTCDYTPYQNQIDNYSNENQLLKKNISESPIRYIQNITYVNDTRFVEVEKPVYVERPVPIIILSSSFIISLLITIKLFKFDIRFKLRDVAEEEIKKIESWTKLIKIGSAVTSALILLRLVLILLSI